MQLHKFQRFMLNYSPHIERTQENPTPPAAAAAQPFSLTDPPHQSYSDLITPAAMG
jgi:hypothetical protein